MSFDEKTSRGNFSFIEGAKIPFSPSSSQRPFPHAQDCICLAVAHSAFDIPWLIKHSRPLMDATGVTRFLNGDRSNLVHLGGGTGARVGE